MLRTALLNSIGLMTALALTPDASALQIQVERAVKQEGFLGASKVVPQRVTLASYSLDELKKRKSSDLNEVDPETQSKARFQGVSLSDVVNEALGSLSVEERAHIDLLVMEGENGRTAYMPKAFVVKYPSIQLALKKDGRDLAQQAPRVVLPATSSSKIQKESLILEPLYLSGLKSITFTSYEDRFGAFLLKRRTDPAAMRGEKLFLQNCVGCHGGPSAGAGIASRLNQVQSGGHPEVPPVGKIPTRLEKKEVRSLTSYLEAFQVQAQKR